MSPANARPLITVLGASGFVGSAVTAALAACPVRLRAVARGHSTVPPGRAEVEVRTADLTAAGGIEAAAAGSDAVIHLAMHSGGWRGADDPGSERVNVLLMRDLLEYLRVDRGPGPAPVVVFAGSSSQVGVAARMPIDGSEPDFPETPYDRQKQAAEDLLKAATARGVVRGVSLRLPTVFGPAPAGASDRGVLATMVRRALSGQPITMWHDGTVERDLVYVHDVAAAFVAAVDHAGSLAGKHWLIGTGRGAPLGDVFRTIAELVSEVTALPPVPVTSVAPPAQATVTDLRSVVIDPSAFQGITGWRAQLPLREALKRTVDALAGTRRLPV